MDGRLTSRIARSLMLWSAGHTFIDAVAAETTAQVVRAVFGLLTLALTSAAHHVLWLRRQELSALTREPCAVGVMTSAAVRL